MLLSRSHESGIPSRSVVALPNEAAPGYAHREHPWHVRHI
jgi:hypothetical protein